MEYEYTPEVQSNPFGKELSEKITEMMRHPKSDMSAEMLDDFAVEYGDEAVKEISSYDRSLRTAYHEPLSGLTAYLEMPELGSERSHEDDTRWELFIKIPRDMVGGSELVKTYQIEISEGNFMISLQEDTLVYTNGRLDRGRGANLYSFDDSTEKTSQFERHEKAMEFKKHFNTKEYTPNIHVQIIEMLNTFEPENEVLRYDPANGRGIFY